MKRQQELYEKSKSTYDKASRGGLKIREPLPASASRPRSPAPGKAGSPQPRNASTEAGSITLSRVFSCRLSLLVLHQHLVLCPGEKAHRPHPADAAAAAAAAKPQAPRPDSAVQSQKSLTSPVKAADITRQGSKVADISRQFSKAADLARQGSGGSDISFQGSRASDSYSPQKAGPRRQSSTAASRATTAPAISAALARASQQATPSAVDGATQPSSSITVPTDSSFASLAAADAPAGVVTASIPQQLPFQGQVLVPGTTAAGESRQSADQPSNPSSHGPAALASFPKIPLLQPREPSPRAPGRNQTQPSVPHKPTSPPQEVTGGSLEMSVLRSSGRAQANFMPMSAQASEPSSYTQRTQSETSGRPDASILMPSAETESHEQIRSTLTAVQRDYVNMIGEQEEVRQAHAAVAAEIADEAGGEEGSDITGMNGPGVADLFQPAYIPAVPAMPRTTARRGNNALFQKLAAGAGKQSVIAVP